MEILGSLPEVFGTCHHQVMTDGIYKKAHTLDYIYDLAARKTRRKKLGEQIHFIRFIYNTWTNANNSGTMSKSYILILGEPITISNFNELPSMS